MKRHQQFSEWDIRLIPWVYILVAFALGYTVPNLNYRLFPWLVSSMDRDVLIAILSAVSTGMIALTGIVFSLAIIYITFLTTTYSPRLVSVLASKTLLHAVGIFTGTFLFTLFALRNIGTSHADGSIGALSVWVTFIWLLASVFILIQLALTPWRITESEVLNQLSAAGLREIRQTYQPYADTSHEKAIVDTAITELAPMTQQVTYDGAPRYLLIIDVPQLVELAQQANAVIRLPFGIGDPVIAREPLAVVHGADTAIPEERLSRAIVLSKERSIRYHPQYAIRLLVDIAIRALSPAVNDPTTAVEVLDQIEAMLIDLGNSQLDIGQVKDAAGTLRLVFPASTWEDYLALSLLEIMHYGADSVQVERRLGALLHHLAANVPASRRSTVERLAEERLATIHRAFPDAVNRIAAERRDRQGLGRSWRDEPGSDIR